MADNPQRDAIQSGQPKREGSFLALPKAQSQASVPADATPTAPPPRRGFGVRVVLPVLLFVLLIAGVAWVSQYLPSWKEGKPLPPPPRSPVVFTPITTEAEGPDGYHREFERDVKGHLDYLFQNTSRGPAEVGINWRQCVCSGVQIALLKPEDATPLVELGKKDLRAARAALEKLTATLDDQWKDMQLDDTKGVDVPPGSFGVARIHWRPHTEDPAFKVSVQIWVKPAGVAFRDRLLLGREATVALVPPVRLFPQKMDIGEQLSVTKHFLFWSATRDQLKVTVTAEPDPCFVWKVKRIPAENFTNAQNVLASRGILTRIRSACQLSVTVYEKRKGKQLDMGALIQPIPVRVEADGEVLNVPNPVLVGMIQSDIELVGVDKFGQINLGSFKRSEGKKSEPVHLVTRSGVNLKKITPDSPLLHCKLTKQKGTEPVWDLEISVPPDAGLDPDTSVVLEETEPGKAPRRIRIHVVGTAAQD
jgi:hypothetical protein